MRSHPPKRSFDGSGPSGPIQANESLNRSTFALFSSFVLLLAVIGLSSCAGYTSAAAKTTTPGSGILSAAFTSLSFGNVAVGGNSTQSLSLTNTGTATVNVSQATISGAGFTVISGNPASALPVGQSITLQIQFAPLSGGAVSGSVVVTSDAANSPLTVSLTGTGTQTGLTISPGSISFGNVTVGQLGSQIVTLTNSGNVNLVVNCS